VLLHHDENRNGPHDIKSEISVHAALFARGFVSMIVNTYSQSGALSIDHIFYAG
jgi:hypothetical protein